MKQFNELGYFVNKDGIKSTFLDKRGQKIEFETDTVKPKKVTTPYMFYFVEQHKKRKADNVDDGLKITQFTKVISEKWKTMTEEEKKKYTDMHNKDVERHENQYKELREKGFFMTADGVKSSDLPPKNKAKK